MSLIEALKEAFKGMQVNYIDMPDVVIVASNDVHPDNGKLLYIPVVKNAQNALEKRARNARQTFDGYWSNRGVAA
jgi:hypothetical protein